MHPNVAFYHIVDFNNDIDVEEELHSILDKSLAREGTERGLAKYVYRSVRVDEGLSEAVAIHWTNLGGIEEVDCPTVFPVYSNGDMLSDLAHDVELEDIWNEGGYIRQAKRLFGPRVLAVEVVGESDLYTEKIQVMKVNSDGPFFVFDYDDYDDPWNKHGDMKKVAELHASSGFLTFDVAFDHAKCQSRRGLAEYIVCSVDANGKKVIHAKVKRTRTMVTKTCTVHYLTRPVNNARPTGALVVIPPKPYSLPPKSYSHGSEPFTFST